MLSYFLLSFKSPQASRAYQSFTKRHFWLLGILFALLKLAYNIAYFVRKYKIGVDELYLGLMIGNLLLLLLLSAFSKCSYYVCKLLAFWSVLGLFFESLQYDAFIQHAPPQDCQEHQMRIASFVPLTFYTAALLQDSWLLVPPIRIGALIMLSWYDESCGVSLSFDNYLTWLIGDCCVYWLLCYLAEGLKKRIFLLMYQHESAYEQLKAVLDHLSASVILFDSQNPVYQNRHFDRFQEDLKVYAALLAVENLNIEPIASAQSLLEQPLFDLNGKMFSLNSLREYSKEH